MHYSRYDLRQRTGPIFSLNLNCDGTEQTLADCNSESVIFDQFDASYDYWIECERAGELVSE